MSRVKVVLAVWAICWLAGCRDPACRIDGETQSLHFEAPQGAGLPPAQRVEVTFEGRALLASYGSQESKPAWLDVSQIESGSQKSVFQVQVVDTTMPLDIYVTLIRFMLTGKDGSEASCVELPVTYSVQELRQAPQLVVTPTAPALQVDTSTTEAQLTVPLELSSSGKALDWRVVSITGNWLEASVTSGNTQTETSPQLRVRKSTVEGLDNGTYSATVTLAHGAAASERQVAVPVTLTVALPRVRTVTPYAIEAGGSLGHILRGDGFSGLKSGQSLRIGPTFASTYQVVSDTELRLDVPALPVGAHAVRVDNALGLSKPGTTLHAVQTPAFSEFVLAQPTGPKRLLYDPLRLAIYSVEYRSGTQHTGLYRYRYVDGTWQQDELMPVSGGADVAMDVDGQSLYLYTSDGLYRLNLNDPRAPPQFLRAHYWDSKLEVLNDGYLLVTSRECTHTATSLDGRRAIISGEYCTSDSYMRFFDASSTQPQSAPISTDRMGMEVAVDRTARYVATYDTVFDSQWRLVATLGLPMEGLIFSPDARRLVGFSYNSGAGAMMYVYDVSSPPVRWQFPRLAALPMEDMGTGGWTGLVGFITPDGRTLITLSTQRFHVYPLPAFLQ